MHGEMESFEWFHGRLDRLGALLVTSCRLGKGTNWWSLGDTMRYGSGACILSCIDTRVSSKEIWDKQLIKKDR